MGTTIQTGQAGQHGSVGIAASSSTKGKVEVDISGGSITTLARVARGIVVWQDYGGPGQAGDTTVNIHNDASITTSGAHAPAVLITRRTDGKNKTDLKDVTISTMGENSFGVSALQDNSVDTDLVGDVEVNLLGGVNITTAGDRAHGVNVRHLGENTEVESHAVITARGRNTITTSGGGAVGLRAERGFGGAGDIRIDLQDISITTKSTASVNTFGDTLADGIYAHHRGNGDIDIDTDRAIIETKGVFSRGVIASHEGAGNINLDIRGGSVKTEGEFAYGIYGVLTKTDHGGTISIRTSNGNAITTTGDNGHGIVAYNYGTLDTRTINIDVGGTVTTTGGGRAGRTGRSR